MTTDYCKKCNQEIKYGELVTGQSWSGDGGEHITCPEPEVLHTDDVEYMPVDEHTGVYEMTSSSPNPYLAMVARAGRK